MLSFYVKFGQTDGQTERQTDGHHLNNMPLILQCKKKKMKISFVINHIKVK